jgi:flavin-dependent dehydrogenase
MDLRLPQQAVAQDIRGTVTFIDDEVISTKRNPGCILNREVADALMAERAVRAGAQLKLRTSATSLESSTDGVCRVGLTTKGPEALSTMVTARVVIGADGPRSMVGASAGTTNTRTVVAHQVTVDLRDPGVDTEVYLHPLYRGGYAWLFPKGDIANVGVGVDRALGGNPREALGHFLGTLGDRIGKVHRSTGGLIPVSGPLPPVHGRVLLAGDAAGHTHPITGGGIHQATEAGRMAGVAAAATVAGDDAAMETYKRDFLSLFSLHLGRATDRRHELERGWAKAEGDAEAFKGLMRRGWIGFPEYYRMPRKSEG